jgi:hypothetical protein
LWSVPLTLVLMSLMAPWTLPILIVLILSASVALFLSRPAAFDEN